MRVRAVVVNWNSFELTNRCLEALQHTDSALGELEVTVIDNGSVDGSLDQLQIGHPWVSFICNDDNLGFAEACNQGMRDRTGIDAIALINNDTMVEPGWLDPLIESLVEQPGVGAVASLLILDPPFAKMNLALAEAVMVTSVVVDREDVTNRCLVVPGERIGDPAWPLSTRYRAEGDVAIYVPAPATPGGIEVELAPLSGAAPIRMVHDVEVERVELLNGLGTRRTAWGEAYDVGFGEELASFEASGFEARRETEKVDGFCGGGVLLRSSALDEVGLFDPRFFAYYEDTDLSWRLRKAGWEIVTAPKSRIRHAFGGSGGSQAPWFFFLNYRNWLLTTLRNGDRGDLRMAMAQLRQWLSTASRANIASRLKHGRAPSLRLVMSWTRVLAGVLVELPRLRIVRNDRIGLVSTRQVRSFLQPR